MGINSGQIAGSNFNLEIDGFSAGYLSSFQVPTYEAEEATNALGPDYVTKKMVGRPKVGEATAVFNISQSARLLEWIASLWKKTCKVEDTTIHLADHNYVIQRSIDMTECLITEISFPDLKASDTKKSLDVTAKWRPQGIAFHGKGGRVRGEMGQKAKAWMVSNFEVHNVFGLNTSVVTSAQLPKITAKVVDEKYGERRFPIPMYAAIEFSTIKLEIGGAGAEQARALAVKIIRDGNVAEANWDDIIIDVKDQTLKTVLGTFTLIGCLLKKFDWASKLEGGKDAPVSTTLEFLVEDFRFDIKHK